MPEATGRSAIVTGASTGLGAAIARELVAGHTRVLMCSRSVKKLRAARDAICADLSPAPEVLAGDVTDPDTAPALVRRVEQSFGGLDILVCNAGGPTPGNFEDHNDEAWRQAFELILMSTIRLIRAALPLLRKSAAGRIVMVGSVSAFRPVPRLALSNVLRPALSGLARDLAVQLGPDGILINVVAPGFFDTDRSREVRASMARNAGVEPEDIEIQLRGQVPLGRQGDPPELGKLVSFLTSTENGFVTGQTIAADGGLLLRG